MFDSNAQSPYENLEVVSRDKNISLATTSGHVYFTDDIFQAYQYGYIACQRDSSDMVYIFEIELNNEILSPDYDELYLKGMSADSYGESIKQVGSCCMMGDIDLTNNKTIRYLLLDYGINDILYVANIKRRTRNCEPNEFQQGFLTGSYKIFKGIYAKKWLYI